MIHVFRLFLIAVLLAGCAYQPVFNSDPIKIAADQRDEYWTPMSPTVDVDFGPLSDEQRRQGGKAVVEYLIDSNGKVTHVRILDASPVPVWGEIARRVVAAYEYDPAPGNAERVPVMVTREVTFRAAEKEE